jgi:hypothetical protein
VVGVTRLLAAALAAICLAGCAAPSGRAVAAVRDLLVRMARGLE